MSTRSIRRSAPRRRGSGRGRGRVAAALAVLAALVTGLALSGCARVDTGRKPGQLDIVAAFYPLKFVAQQIGGTHVHVTDLTKPGAEPHDLELTPRQVGWIEQSDVTVYLKGLQPAVDEAVRDNGPRHVVDAAAVTPTEEHGEEVDGTHAVHAHDVSVPDGGDPHVWLDPVRMSAIAQRTGDTLAAVDPANAAEYHARTADLQNRLSALDADYRTGLAQCPRSEFVTSHAAFGYLAERYGLDEIAVTGISPEAEPSPARIADIQRQITHRGVTTVFFETLASPKTAKTIAHDLGLKSAVLDPLEGVQDESTHDYFTVMHANLDALREALGCQ